LQLQDNGLIAFPLNVIDVVGWMFGTWVVVVVMVGIVAMVVGIVAKPFLLLSYHSLGWYVCCICQSVAIVVVIIRAPFLLVYTLGYSSQLSFTIGFFHYYLISSTKFPIAFLSKPVLTKPKHLLSHNKSSVK